MFYNKRFQRLENRIWELENDVRQLKHDREELRSALVEQGIEFVRTRWLYHGGDNFGQLHKDFYTYLKEQGYQFVNSPEERKLVKKEECVNE